MKRAFGGLMECLLSPKRPRALEKHLSVLILVDGMAINILASCDRIGKVAENCFQ
jgi:hypothetical protein